MAMNDTLVMKRLVEVFSNICVASVKVCSDYFNSFTMNISFASSVSGMQVIFNFI